MWKCGSLTRRMGLLTGVLSGSLGGEGEGGREDERSRGLQ